MWVALEDDMAFGEALTAAEVDSEDIFIPLVNAPEATAMAVIAAEEAVGANAVVDGVWLTDLSVEWDGSGHRGQCRCRHGPVADARAIPVLRAGLSFLQYREHADARRDRVPERR